MSRSASFSDWPPASDLANNSCIRSRVRNIRLIVLNASTLEAFVNKAGAAMNVTTANGLCDNDVGSIISGQKIERTTPPSTRNAAPLVADERGLARNATNAATSSVVAKRCNRELGRAE